MTSAVSVAEISRAIHDPYFDAAAYSFDAVAEEVRVLFFEGEERTRLIGSTSRPPSAPLPPPSAELVIRKVLSLTLQDDAEVGWVDVHGLDFDASRNLLQLSGNIPVELTCEVRALDVELITE